METHATMHMRESKGYGYWCVKDLALDSLCSVQIKASSIDLVKFCHPAKKKEQLQFLVLREYILKRT